MGNCLASIFRRRNMRRQIVLILIGLDNAGKTKTVNNLAGEKDDKVLPTVGFKAVNLVHKDTPVTIYDLGGGPHFRQIWSQYYSEVHGVIFVIDSSDFSRLEECKEVLEEVLSHDKIAGKPVLVLANKQDKSGALDDIDVVEKLNIEPLVNKYRCPTLVESYSASQILTKSKKPKIDPGLRKGYHWLLNYIIKRYGDINLRVQTDIHAELERRKRMLNKASNTTSFSDEIATQTGFENPSYDIDKTIKISDKSREESNPLQGVIIVKPVTNSVDSTITIESLDSETTSNMAKPKLSPLFGRSSNSTMNETVRIELEPRNEFRKLSPIVRNKSGGNQHIDFMNRPQSSPTYKKIKKDLELSPTEEVNISCLRDLDFYNLTRLFLKRALASSCPYPNLNEKELELSSNEEVTTDYKKRNATWDGERKTVVVNDNDLVHTHREIVLNERDYNKTACSEVTLQASTLPPLDVGTRPASASQLVRRQLELSAAHKRRLSLRYMQRNKTSPERVSMLFLPKAPQRLDKGDFDHAATIN